MMEAEMDNHLGYEKSERSDNDDYRNGYKRKHVNSSYGSMKIEVPQDRESTFQPQIIKNGRKIFLIPIRRLFPCMPREWPSDRFLKQSRIFTALKFRKDLFLMWLIRPPCLDWRLIEPTIRRGISDSFYRCHTLFCSEWRDNPQTCGLCDSGHQYRRQERSYYHSGWR